MHEPGASVMLAHMALLIGEIFRRAARAVPQRIAATLDGDVLSFGALNAQGNRLGHALAALGIERGDRVIWWGDTTLDALPVFVALAKLGAVFAPINARFGPDEATAVARLARARLLLADATHAEAAEVVAKAADIPLLARVGGMPGPGSDLSQAAMRSSEDEVRTPALDENDPHVIFFTSGSTGRPKGVVLPHRVNWLRSFQGPLLGGRTSTVCMFPLFHMAGWTLALGAWQARDPISFVRTPSAEALLDTVQSQRATRLYCIPAVWARILEADLERWDLTSLHDIDTGTSATPPELISALKERFPGTSTRINYGSTEGGAGTILADEDLIRKPGSVGLPAGGVELRLSDAGEVCVHSDCLMSGYFDDPEASAAVLSDGWYHTGDLGALDEEGYLSIVGRVRDVIRSGGETIAPAEVEQALADHPAVAEVAVVGLPDPRWGEIVCAVVVPRPGVTLELEDLRRHAAQRLASFKQPRRLEQVEALPRTPATGQIQRTLLIERLAAREG